MKLKHLVLAAFFLMALSRVAAAQFPGPFPHGPGELGLPGVTVYGQPPGPGYVPLSTGNDRARWYGLLSPLTTCGNFICINPATPITVTAQTGGDICAKFNTSVALSYASTPPMAPIYWPPGNYTATTQCTIPMTSSANNDEQSNRSGNLDIYAYGVRLSTTGAINGINVYAGGGGGNKTTLRGLTVVHDNADQVNGYDVGQASDFTCEDCKYDNSFAGVPNPLSIAIRIGNRVAGDDTTFTQSAKFIRPKIMCLDKGARVGGGTRIAKGISIQRAANVSIVDGTIFSCFTQILLTDDPLALTGIGPENVNIVNNDIEGTGSTTGGVISDQGSAIATNFTTDAAAPQSGSWNFIGNTIDNDNVAFQMQNVPSQTFIYGPYMAGNQIIPNNKQYINNPHNQLYATYDNYPFGARSISPGFYMDSLALGGGSTQGIQGSLAVNKLAVPDVLVVPNCTVAGGETCSTQRCYRLAAIDYAGRTTLPVAEVCTTSGPDTLNSTNVVYVYPRFFLPVNGVAGWKVFGRATGAEQFMNPNGKSINGVSVSLLNTDPGVYPTSSSVHSQPVFVDDGSVTPGGAMPTIATTGIFSSPIVQRVPTTFASLPTCAAGTQGYQAMITDDNSACTFGTAATGIGSTVCSVGCDGTSYKAGY